jgi:hypothetical protein
MDNGTLKCVRNTTVGVEKQYILHTLRKRETERERGRMCVCVCTYPAWKARAPYYHLFPPELRHVFPHYLNTRFSKEKKITEDKMCVWIFYTTFIWNNSHFRKNVARYFQKCSYACTLSTSYVYQILIKSEFYKQIFDKIWNIRTHIKS